MDITILVEQMANQIGIEDRELIVKAAELYRITDLKLQMQTRNSRLTQSSKISICLNLAADCLHKSISKKELIRTSGNKKSQYEHLYKTISTILNIENSVGINDLCVKLDVCSVRELANEIYDVFCKKFNDCLELNHPQYKVLSIFCACKLSKIKIYKNICIQYANLNLISFNKLLNKFNEFIKENNFEKVSEKLEKNDVENKFIKKMKSPETDKLSVMQTDEVSYEIWKNQILENAFKQLRSIDHKNSFTNQLTY